MSRPLRVRRGGARIGMGGGLALMLLGCASLIPLHHGPSPSEPSAVLKARVVNHAWPGSQCAASILVDGERVETDARVRMRCDVTEATTLALGPTMISLATRFWNTYTSTTSHWVSNGTGGGHMVPTTTTMTVAAGGCTEEFALAPKLNDVYLLQIDYFGNDTCSAHCFQQIDGELRPCDAAEAVPAP